MSYSAKPFRRPAQRRALATALAFALAGAVPAIQAAEPEAEAGTAPALVRDGLVTDFPVIDNFFGGGGPADGLGELGQSGVTGNTLEDFYSAALDFNPSLDIARERWNIGTARRQAATGQLLPQVSATANISDNTRDPFNEPAVDYRGERYSVQLRQALFNWQAFATRGQAALEEDRAQAEYYAELARVLADVSTRYLAVLEAQDALGSTRAELDAIQNQVNQVQRMYDLQLARVTDLYEAQARLEGVRADLVQRESELYLYQEALSAATGITVGNLYVLEEGTQLPSIETPLEDWVARARELNPSILARRYAAAAADKNVSRQRGAYLPQVNLVVQQQQANVGFDNIPISKYDSTYVGVEVNMPLFAGGGSRARVKEAVSQRAIARDELRQMQLDTIERTRTAYLQAVASERRAAAGRRLLESSQTAYEAMQRGFELGTVTSVEVLNALGDRFQAQRDMQASRYSYLKSRLDLQREAGTLSADDLMEVGGWLAPPADAAGEE